MTAKSLQAIHKANYHSKLSGNLLSVVGYSREQNQVTATLFTKGCQRFRMAHCGCDIPPESEMGGVCGRRSENRIEWAV